MSTVTDVSLPELEHLVQMATYAPSVHNTQPWCFTPTREGLQLEADRSRQLEVIDPEGRELLMSCGAALHHLEVAARALSLDLDIEVLPLDRTSTGLARIHLRRGTTPSPAEQAASVAILHRHTHRGRFADERVPMAQLERLRQVVEQQGAMFRPVSADELIEVEVLVSRAEQALLQTPGYADELTRWVWHDDSVDRSDGLPLAAVEHGPSRAESLQGRQFDGQPAALPQEPPTAEHPTVVVVSTTGDSPVDWLEAGRALSALLLTATDQELLAQPIGQVIDVPSSRRALQQALHLLGTPQMLLRLGRGKSVPLTPRRPVDEVFEH